MQAQHPVWPGCRYGPSQGVTPFGLASSQGLAAALHLMGMEANFLEGDGVTSSDQIEIVPLP